MTASTISGRFQSGQGRQLLSAVRGWHDRQEEILFTVLDFSAKFVYTLSVLVVNFTLFDQAVEVRLEMAQEYLALEVNRNADVRAPTLALQGIPCNRGPKVQQGFKRGSLKLNREAVTHSQKQPDK